MADRRAAVVGCALVGCVVVVVEEELDDEDQGVGALLGRVSWVARSRGRGDAVFEGLVITAGSWCAEALRGRQRGVHDDGVGCVEDTFDDGVTVEDLPETELGHGRFDGGRWVVSVGQNLGVDAGSSIDSARRQWPFTASIGASWNSATVGPRPSMRAPLW